MSKALSSFYAFKFVRLLTKEWTDTEAYEHGIIDENGKLLKTVRELKTHEEKKAYSHFHRLAFNIRRMLQKLPLGSSSIARYATAIKLIKEHVEDDENLIEDAFVKHLFQNDIKIPRFAQLIKEDTSNYVEMFGMFFEENEDGELELVDEMISTGGFDLGNHASRPSKKKVEEDNGDCSFAGNAVFNCDSDTFMRCRQGKKKYTRYAPYVGDDDIGERIRQYGRNNPKKGIVLRDGRTGAMLYLRRGD